MRVWKKIITLAAAAALAAAMSMTAFAGTSLDGTKGDWRKDDTGWWWQNEDGTWLHSGWFWLDGNEDGVAECYLFDGNGYMAENGVSLDGFRTNADGAWVDENGVVQTRTVGSQLTPASVQQQENTNAATGSYTDNGGYNEYGCSNVAMEMFANSREENAKFGEVTITDNSASTYVTYTNGFAVSYPTENSWRYKRVYVDETRSDLDPTYLFKYYDPALSVDEAIEYLHSVGFQDGAQGVYKGANDAVIKVGKTSTGVTGILNWHSTGVLVLR